MSVLCWWGWHDWGLPFYTPNENPELDPVLFVKCNRCGIEMRHF